MITEENAEKAKRLIRKVLDRPIVVLSQSAEFNHSLLEFGKFDILLSPEKLSKKDRLRQLNSGFNHVLARIAAKKNVAVGIDLKEIRELNRKEKAVRLARIGQNLKVCRKAKCRIAVIDYKSARDVFAFLLSLGASTLQAHESVKHTV